MLKFINSNDDQTTTPNSIPKIESYLLDKFFLKLKFVPPDTQSNEVINTPFFTRNQVTRLDTYGLCGNFIYPHLSTDTNNEIGYISYEQVFFIL